MKTLSRTFRLVVLGAIVTVVVVGCCNLPFLQNSAFLYSVEIRGKQNSQIYVEWKDEKAFETALGQLVAHGGKICLCVLKDARGNPHPHKRNNDCRSKYDCPLPANIKTAKVTKSIAAAKIAAGESAVNDPNVVHSLRSLNPNDIIDVLKTLNP